MSDPGDVPPEILDRLSRICLALPEAYEEDAWVGVRWRIRMKTIAHVRTVDRPTGATGPLVVMTFRAPDDEVGAFANGGRAYFRADWGHNVVGLRFSRRTDWAEVRELLTESYRIQAPKKLAALLPDPAG
ncbi:MmcQ/YjbR family DNA-binding protein [Asanoa iriomotensis]|uniref:YjbR protein n=1 Tax=Asanoa iriomotensis TaxID=234613 RepID=A0ABQ4C3E3_9ACTN|nr:MmcQ/YjbR family DNA-binding protein [Asanoa iriomotensis]GIF57297.1 hypothetical protein Air01nite_33920 [Asanoa iriomotensis]